MRTFLLFISILFWGLFTGCETEPIPSTQEPTTGNILSRSNVTKSLPAGSQVLLNAIGGLNIENQAFTFDGSAWNNDNGQKWGNVENITYITALYPIFEDKQYTSANLYDESGLRDILIAQDTISRGTNVELTFKHLFASFILKVEESLANQIEEIQLISPKSVKSISTTTGEITLSDISSSTTLVGNGSDSYTFIIPPMQASLTLNITLKDNSDVHPYQLNNHTFKSGFIYECRLRDKNNVPGIRTVADWKTFCQQINNGEKATQFGELQSDGRMLYRLLADINLEGIALSPIGEGKPFTDIFDGEGHTITKLTLKASDGAAGLFYQLDSKGKIQNLYLDYCTMDIPENASASSGVGSIAGICAGIISNCGITNGSITNKKNSYTGGIVGTLRNGIIINCFVKNTEVITTSASLGGFVGKIETGNIINCYSASNTITRSSNYSGGFCGYADNGNITNCYVYNLTFVNKNSEKNKEGQFIGRGVDSSVIQCFTDTGTSTYYIIQKKEGDCISTPNFIYQSDFTNSQGFVFELLNQWITNNQSSYENYTFTTWEKDTSGTLPAIFQ